MEFIKRFRRIKCAKSFRDARECMVTMADVEAIQKGAYSDIPVRRLSDVFVARALSITARKWRQIKQWVSKANVPKRAMTEKYQYPYRLRQKSCFRNPPEKHVLDFAASLDAMQVYA